MYPDYRENSVICEHCNGNGEEPFSGVPCPFCGGAGWLLPLNIDECEEEEYDWGAGR